MSPRDNIDLKSNNGIDKLKDTYLNWTQKQLSRLKEHLRLLEKPDTKNPAAHITDIFNLSHNIKGIGGNFGYYLITDIAKSLCEYVRYKETLPSVQPYIISAHLKAMTVILSEKIDGSGGEDGNNIIARLHKMVEEENNNQKIAQTKG